MNRRSLIAALSTLPFANVAFAQSYPVRPVSLIVPSAPGGVVDVVTRILQPELQRSLSQAVVVDNKPGGGGHIGAALAARAAPDGYTVLASAGSVLTSGVYRKLSYSPERDLVPVCMVMTGSFMLLVPASSPHTTVGALVAYAKANPGKLSYASSGTGNSTHIAAEMLKSHAGFDALHVPYRGSVPALTDLLSGRIDFFIDNKASAMPQVKSGALRVLAVTSPKRVADLPDVPAMAEFFPGYGVEGWIGLFVPRGTPGDVIVRIESAAKAAVAMPDIAQRIHDTAGEPRFMGSSDLQTFMAQERTRFAKVVNAANITAD
jgi:tripartite-type tricarboxylate transporter receptor subunit TctC